MEISLDPASGVTLFYQDGMVLTRFPAASSIIGHRFPNALSLTLVLHKLKSLGVQIALDDFGSGYSSLSYLHAFPFGKIKIDRAFVGDLEHNHHSMAIVRAIITLGHSLDVPILAEGGSRPRRSAHSCRRKAATRCRAI